MKAIIPVAGVGTRLRPHTYTQPKPLIPVAGKPILGAIIEQLVDANIQDFILIVGYLGDKIKHYVEKQYPQLNVEFVYQDERLGLGHAIWTARESFRNCDEILIVLGDSIFDADLEGLLRMPHSCIGVKKVENPREFGVVEIDEQGFIKKMVEKPRIPKSNLAIIGLYRILEVQQLIAALDYIIEQDIKTNEEYQLTDALCRMVVDQNCRIATVKVETWFDCGKKDILLETNALLLRRYALPVPDMYENTIFIPPVSIGKNCSIRNSVIGPNVSVGDSAQIDSSVIRHSIVGNYTSLHEIVLQRSVIGNDSSIKGPGQSLNIGDNTDIDFS